MVHDKARAHLRPAVHACTPSSRRLQIATPDIRSAATANETLGDNNSNDIQPRDQRQQPRLQGRLEDKTDCLGRSRRPTLGL